MRSVANCKSGNSGFCPVRAVPVKSDRIADRSMEILVDRIEEEKEAIHELVSFDIIAGESVAKVSAQK